MVGFTRDSRFKENSSASGSAGYNFNPNTLSGTGLPRSGINPTTKFGKSPRFDPVLPPKDNKLPPPQYMPTAHDTKAGGGFGKASRFEKNIGSGSGHFADPSLLSSFNKGTTSIGKTRRFDQGTADLSSPGPAAYGAPSTKAGTGAHMGTSSRFRTSGPGLGPGPGAYGARSTTGSRGGGASFGTGNRFDAGGTRPNTAAISKAAPPPPSSPKDQSYLKPQSSLTRTGASFGTSSRFGTSAGGNRRSKSKSPDEARPGSAQYNPSSFSNLGYNKPSVNFTSKFGLSKRFTDAPHTHTPGPMGPSVHQTDAITNNTTGHFSKSKRWTANKNTSETTPGPAAYAAASDPAHAAKIATSTMGRADRFGIEALNAPGPSYMPPGIERTGSAVAWGKATLVKAAGAPLEEVKEGPGFIAAPSPQSKGASSNFGSAKRFDGGAVKAQDVTKA